MKNILLVFITIFSANFSFGQITHAQKIIDFYGQPWYDEMESINPGLLFVLDRYIEEGIKVEEITDDKYLLFEPIEKIPLTDGSASVPISDFLNDYNSGFFNPLIYDYYPSNAIQVYRLGGVNKILIIQSQAILLNN